MVYTAYRTLAGRKGYGRNNKRQLDICSFTIDRFLETDFRTHGEIAEPAAPQMRNRSYRTVLIKRPDNATLAKRRDRKSLIDSRYSVMKIGADVPPGRTGIWTARARLGFRRAATQLLHATSTSTTCACPRFEPAPNTDQRLAATLVRAQKTRFKPRAVSALTNPCAHLNARTINSHHLCG